MMRVSDRVSPDRMAEDLGTARMLLDGASAAPAEGTTLRMLADSCMEMAECYVSDALHFLESGDAVTAFAAANYAAAWLDIGERSGLLAVTRSGAAPAPGGIPDDALDAIDDGRMERYLGITARARDEVRIAVPERSFGLRMAEWCLSGSDALYSMAADMASEGDYVGAFATVNRAHAWLDFGARTGLFDVGGDDVLFTLYERGSRGNWIRT